MADNYNGDSYLADAFRQNDIRIIMIDIGKDNIAKLKSVMKRQNRYSEASQ